MELSWSDEEEALPLVSFLEQFKLPQIVQIDEGEYGNSEETTLSRGQELNLHALKDTQCYLGVTDTEEQIYIPLNSPHKVHVSVDKYLEDCNTCEKACAIFPSKYKHVRFQNSEKLRALYFDRDTMELICSDDQDCEVTFRMDVLNRLLVTENCEEIFVAEVRAKQISPPFTMQFIEQKGSSGYLSRGLIQVKEIVSKQTIIATSRGDDSRSILTFPSTLDVTVFAPQEATESHLGYRNLCENINRKINLRKVKEKIDDGIYDDVETSGVATIPNAATFYVPLAVDRSGSSEEPASSKTKPNERPPKNTGRKKTNRFLQLFRREKSRNSGSPPTTTAPVSETEGQKDPSVYERLFHPNRNQSDRKIKDFTVQEVRLLLNDLGIGQYGEIFETEQVDGRILMDLGKEILKSDFNMIDSHARKLVKATHKN